MALSPDIFRDHILPTYEEARMQVDREMGLEVDPTVDYSRVPANTPIVLFSEVSVEIPKVDNLTTK